MCILSILALLGQFASMGCVAAFLPARQAPASPPPCSPTTVYATVTATADPSTVTVLQYNPGSISAQASSDAAIDTEYESEQSELRPVSDQPSTGLPVYTHTLTAPAFPASEGSDGAYWFQSRPTTRWGLIPTGDNLPVATITVTVSPYPAPSPDSAGDGVPGNTSNAAAATATDQAAGDTSYSIPPYGYANTTSTSLGSGGYATNSAVLTLTSINDVATTTLSVEVNVTGLPIYGTSMQYQPTGTAELSPRDTCGSVCVWVCRGKSDCWCNNWSGKGVTSTATCYSTTTTPTPIMPSSTVNIAHRQICTLVSAPGFGTWCNNWDGTTANDYTVWDSTTTPGVPVSSQPSTTTEATATSIVSLEPSSSPATQSPCGQAGPFEISFDQLPAASIANNDTQYHPPIDQFIDHFVWGLDWTYGPPPSEPYAPHDQSYLGWYIPHLNDNVTNSPDHNTGSIPGGGSFGAGGRKANSSFWFNANSAYAACDDQNLDPNYTCDFVATAFQYAGGNDQVVATQHFNLPPCSRNVSCQLHSIKFNNLFTKLSAISFYANVQGQIKSFYMDSLELDWYDNNCTAGLEREGSP